MMGDAAAPGVVQSGRLGGATAGQHRLLGLHLKAWGRPPYSGGDAQRLRSHREAVTLEPRRTKVTHLAVFDHVGTTA